MSNSCPFSTSKLWITTVADSIKSKNKIFKKNCKEKTHNKREQSLVSINSLITGETITNAKHPVNHFNSFFTSVAANLNEKIVKAKQP